MKFNEFTTNKNLKFGLFKNQKNTDFFPTNFPVLSKTEITTCS